MAWKEIMTDYFTFTRRDRIAILVIIVLLALVFFLPKIVTSRRTVKTTAMDTAWIAALQQLEEKEQTKKNQRDESNDGNASGYQYDRPVTAYYSSGKGELFYFDPNTLSVEGWKKLGIREKTIHTIQKYLGKGGRFKKPADVKKIYGLSPDEYERISPFIKLAADEKPAAGTAYPPAENKPAKTYTPRYSVIDINMADTTAFISLPGIGSKLSARIVNFRDKLGGFYSIGQVAETYGLPDSTFQQIRQYLKLESPFLRKININAATIDELKAHPYIRYAIASPIVAYRKEHGPFAKMEDLKNVMAVTTELYNKLLPYLALE